MLCRSEKTAFACTENSGTAARDGELREDVLGVAAQRVVGDEQLPRDLGAAQLGVEQPQDLQLPLAQRLGKGLARASPGGRGRRRVPAAECEQGSQHRTRALATLGLP